MSEETKVDETRDPAVQTMMAYVVPLEMMADVVDALRDLPERAVGRLLGRLTRLQPQQLQLTE
jgi:hypothetical protein